ncbi:MAG TPA: adenylate/guanylate cyclase domain-containing protein [Aggregatilineales bacterium]|nr:adenylate/guanylate cyclase domain-containing protein [Aggregatilineales bacterium]
MTLEHSVRERELQLIFALDRARDRLHDNDEPQTMFEAIVALLKEQFKAEACAILLVTETSDDVEMLAYSGMDEPSALTTCQTALSNTSIDVVPQTPWTYTLGSQIFLADYPMGSFVLGRTTTDFTPEERALLKTAETQLDSAVVQARTVWKLAQRERELDAIYEIDHLRDKTQSEADLISGFTAILLEQFKADLCLIMLTHTDSGDMLLRGIIDRYDLNEDNLNIIRENASSITIPQVIPSPAGIPGLYLLAAPLIVDGTRHGAVVTGRKAAYSVGDHRLLHAMMSQMDSAVVHIRALSQLASRNRELEIIYRIDRIRDREADFDRLLQSVLTELSQVVASEMGYIMLYSDDEADALEMRSYTSERLLAAANNLQTIQKISKQALTTGKLVCENRLEGALRSILAMPLILNQRIIGVFGAVNSAASSGFSAEDRRILAAITSQVDTAIFERLEQRRMRNILRRSVDPKVVDHLLLHADSHILEGERVILSVIYADLRGSSEWAERTPPEELVDTLNQFLGAMTEIIFKYGGTLDKFVGDMVIGLFGTPLPMQDHALQAARAALDMQEAHTALQRHLKAAGHILPGMGIGISSGEAIAGEFGHPIRTEFTALGRVMNLGSRLCGVAEAGQIVISESTYQLLAERVDCTPLPPIQLKGISDYGTLYALKAVQESPYV